MADEQRYPVEFTATAGQYFRIWIVNLALTIFTLGIYSAWAKVRKRRYFYAHTRLDGEGFEYRANPIAILKGRLLAVGALALFYGTFQLMTLSPLHLLLLVAAFFLVPWLIVRAHAFNAWNTAYRNIRFQFHGKYRRCLWVLFTRGLIVVFTAGLGYPYLKVRMMEFLARNHRYGTAQFDVPDLKPPFFRIYSWAIGLGFLGVLVAFGAIGLLVLLLGRSEQTAGVAGMVGTLSGYALYLVIFAYLRARIANATFNHLKVGPAVRFECALRARDMIALYVTNILAILLTLGLATPWAVVRTLRYRATKLTVIAAGGLAQFAQGEAVAASAAGEEIAEAFDVDFGL